MLTPTEIREKSPEELHILLAELRDTLRETRFNVSQFQHKNYKDLKSLKKDIARVMTVLKERDLIKEM